MNYPKISVITPSFNQGAYIEKTIRSVLDQGYPNLEFIILDAGSTDNSVEIIRKYSDKITFWESKPDKGQADAIYRGFEMAKGDIIAWINSDDYFLEESLKAVGDYFLQNPNTIWLIGNGTIINGEGNEILKIFSPKINFDKILFHGAVFNQPSMFISRKAFFNCGGFDRTMKYSFDLDLYLNLAKNIDPDQIDNFLSAFRFHEGSKTSTMNLTRITESSYIRDVKYKKYTKNRIAYKIKKHFNIMKIVLHRFRTSGIKSYTKFLVRNLL